MKIRTATLGDLPALLALEALFPGDRLSARQFRHHLQRPSSLLRVALDGDAVLGYALTLRRADSSAARLYSIAVAPTARGGGIGRALLADAEAQARLHGADELRLEVRADNAAAIALYERSGYVRFGRRAAYYDDGMDALRWRRALDGKEGGA